MFIFIRDKAIAFHATFHDSEVIWFGRIQVTLGLIWGVLAVTDLSPIIRDPKILTYWLLASGMITEWLRRRRTEIDEQNHLIEKKDDDDKTTGAP